MKSFRTGRHPNIDSMEAERDQLLGQEPGIWNENGELRYPSKKHQNYLACPFPKHDPELHETVNNVCTRPWGFKNITTLIYHIKRVHSLKYGCIRCKKRFTTSTKMTIENARRNHECTEVLATDEDAQWMTEEQELRLSGWTDSEAQDGGAKSWIKIYSCIFPGEHVPTPYYDYLVPRHLMRLAILEYTRTPQTQNHNTDDPGIFGMGTYTNEVPGLQEEDLYAGRAGPTEPPYVDAYGNTFDWSVTPAIDSAYGSGSAMPDPGVAFPKDRAVAPGEYLLNHGDTEAAVQHAGGASDQARSEYGDLKLDENE